ncbi:armadillo repeat-containing protein 5-like [Ornithodoros turicata]|uniref:armadillo repeat-containing protein 5-like n=1 Tax=Ornithodoros turicata TaxID=34597 RepID=UPI00313989E7
MDSRATLMDLITKISSSSFSTTFNALIEVSKICRKNPSAVALFTQLEGIAALIRLIEKPKFSDICLSILANCCLDESARFEVLKSDGLKSVVCVFSCIEKESIRNRACRALANVALTSKGAGEVNRCNAIPHIVEFISSSEQQDSKLTALRAVRILAGNPPCRDKLVRHNAPMSVVKLLPAPELQKAALQALASLSQACSTECALQLRECDGITSLGDILKTTDNSILESVFTILINLTVVGDLRPVLGGVGAVTALVQQLQDYKICRPSYGSLFSALCRYSQESVNRVRLRESGGLSLFINTLKNEQRKELWPCTICAVLQFSYDEVSLEHLWDLGFASTLLLHIQRYTEAHAKEHHDSKGEENTSAGTTVTTTTDNNEITPDDDLAAVEDDFSDVEEHSVSACGGEVKATTQKVFNIHSPSYQEIQNAKILQGIETRSTDSGYNSYQCSPNTTDFGHPVSPRSAGSPVPSEYGLWSPCSSPRCESPVSVASPEPFRCFSPVCSDSETAEDCQLQERAAEATETFVSSLATENVQVQNSISLTTHSSVEHAEISTRNAAISEAQQQTNDLSSEAWTTPSCTTEAVRRRFRSNSSDSSGAQKHRKDSGTRNFRRGSTDSSRSPPRKQRCQSRSSSDSRFVVPKDPQDAFFDAVIRVLCVYSYLESPKFDCAACGLFAALINYAFSVPDPMERAEQALLRLASNVHNFESIIAGGDLINVVREMQRLDDSSCKRCRRCRDLGQSILRRLSSLAESGFGSGVLARALLVEGKDQQQSCSLAVPYVVRQKPILRQLLFDCSGIDHLLDILEEKGKCVETFGLAVDSLHRLCLTLRPELSRPCNRGVSGKSYCHLKAFNCDVRFQLDDGAVLQGNRSELSCKNAFFRGMFLGQFIERGQELVSFPKASSESLAVVLHVLHGCDLEHCPSTMESNFGDCVLVDIGVLRLCDQLLLPNLQESIETRVKKNLTFRTAVKTYECACELDMSELKLFVLRYVMASEGQRDQRKLCFEELLHGGQAGRVLNDIVSLIKLETNMAWT